MNFFPTWRRRRRLDAARRLEEDGRLSEAASRYEEALTALEGRDRITALSCAGRCRLSMGQAGEARRYLEEAVRLAPENATGWLNYGRVLLDLGDTLGADEALQKANLLSPDRPDILYHLAVYYAGKYAKAAVEAARRAAWKTCEFLENPGGPAALRSLGFPPELPLVFIRNLALEVGDPDAGILHLNELADRPSGPETAWVRPAALIHLGLLLTNTGKYGQAETAYRLALEAAPAAWEVHFDRAMLNARQGRLEEAERDLKRYEARTSIRPVILWGRATLAEHRGDAAAALEHYREMLKEGNVSAADLARLDIPRGWLDQAKAFLRIHAGEGEGREESQWTGPGH